MKFSYTLAITLILISASLCFGFYQTLNLGFIHAGIVVLVLSLLMTVLGWVRLVWIRKKKSRSEFGVELAVLVLIAPICLFFIQLSNNLLNKEYITFVNHSNDQIELLSINCNSQIFDFQDLENRDSITIELGSEMAQNLAIEVSSQINGISHQDRLQLKRKTNGIFSPSVVAVDNEYKLIDLNRQRAISTMDKQYDDLAKKKTSGLYNPQTIEAHRQHLKYIKTEGGLMAYLDLGDRQGKPLLLVHGVPTSSWLYRRMTVLLVEMGYRVIVPDLLGFGASDKPPYLDLYHPSQQANRLIALMDTLDIPSWIHLMHDAGGLWSGELFLKAPERVDNIIFLNTIAYKAGFTPPLQFQYGRPLGKVFVGLYNYSLTAKWFMNQTLDGGVNADLKVLSDEDRKGYWLSMTEGTDQAIYEFFTSFDETFERIPLYNEFYKNSSKPAMVIWGMLDDALVGSEQVPLIARDMEIPSRNIHQLDDGIHFLQEERPKELVNFIHDFLTNN